MRAKLSNRCTKTCTELLSELIDLLANGLELPENALFRRGVLGSWWLQCVYLVGYLLELWSILFDQFSAGEFQFGEMEILFMGLKMAFHGLEGGPVFFEDVLSLSLAELIVQEMKVCISYDLADHVLLDFTNADLLLAVFDAGTEVLEDECFLGRRGGDEIFDHGDRHMLNC